MSIPSAVGNFLRTVIGDDVVIKSFNKTINNAAILTFPSQASGIQIYPAAAAGNIRVPLWAFAVADFTAGLYTNIEVSAADAYGAYIELITNGGNGGSSQIFQDAPGYKPFTSIFGSATKKVFRLGDFDILPDPTVFTAGSNQGTAEAVLYADYAGNGVVFMGNSLGNLIGGHVANTLKLWGQYAEITL